MAVYSVLLFNGIVAAGARTLLIGDPSPNTVVIRDIEGNADSSNPDQCYFGVGTAGDPTGGLVVPSLLQPGLATQQWKGRIVIPPGSTFWASPDWGPWNLLVSGYSLTP